MKHTLDIVTALREEVSLLARACPPGESSGVHLKRINALISDLVREIEINGPSA